MLSDGDDLLSQLSCELGLSDLIGSVTDSVTDSPVLSDERTTNLYDHFLPSEDMEDNNLFNELIYNEGRLLKFQFICFVWMIFLIDFR